MTGQEIMDAWEKWKAAANGRITVGSEQALRQAFFAGIDAAENKWREGMKELVEEIGGGEFQ